MVRLVTLCAGLVVYTLGWTRAEAAVALSPCPRPSDEYGPRYEAVSGAYRSHGVSPGGGKFVTIMPRDGAAPVSLNVTDRVLDIAGSLEIGALITVVSYVRASMSGRSRPIAASSWRNSGNVSR